MGRDGEKKTVRQCILDWWLPFVAVVLVIGAGRSFVLWQDRNYGQLTTSLITVLGVVVTLWMTQVRAIEQQEREDKRHHARLEAEAKIHDERLRAEAQKDRVQRSITQRIDLAEKLATAIEHLCDENDLKQAAGVQEILFQIDDWHALIKAEITRIGEEENDVEFMEESLRKESLRHRQELFDIAYKFDAKTGKGKVDLLKSRARGLKQRLVKDGDHSLSGLDFSGIVIGMSSSEESNYFKIDLVKIFAKGFIMSNSVMCNANLSYAHLEGAYLEGAHLEGAHLEGAHLKEAHLEGAHLEGAYLEGAYLEGAHLEWVNLEGAHLEGANLKGANLESVYFDYYALQDKNLLDKSCYDDQTVFPKEFNPKQYGMILVDKKDVS